jgi:hypothetical protein
MGRGGQQACKGWRHGGGWRRNEARQHSGGWAAHGVRSFYSHRIDGPMGRGGIQMLCGDVCPDAPLKPGVRALGASL